MAFYVRDSKLPKDEDQTTEFKGHRTLSSEEINPANVIPVRGKLRRTRQFISKYICGILNTGKGGSLYLGVLDDGNVQGFAMSVFQKDHFKLSLLSCLSNFKPSVASHLVTVKFVPVIESFDDPEVILKKVEHFEQRSLKGTSMDRNKEHTFGVRYCWCDVDALAAFNYGLLLPFYVIEIHIPPWNWMDRKNLEAYGQRLEIPVNNQALTYQKYHKGSVIECYSINVTSTLRFSLPWTNYKTLRLDLQGRKSSGLPPVFTCNDGQTYLRLTTCTTCCSVEDVMKYAAEGVSI